LQCSVIFDVVTCNFKPDSDVTFEMTTQSAAKTAIGITLHYQNTTLSIVVLIKSKKVGTA